MKRLAAVLLTTVFVLYSALGFGNSAQAATSANCVNGGYSVVIDGKTYKGDQTIKMSSFVTKDIQVIGTYNEFSLNVDTFSVKNYTLTGVAGPGDITGGKRTVVYTEKTPQLPSNLVGELEIRLDKGSISLLRNGAIKMKIQANDCSQGGLFQQEADSNVVIKNVLSEGFSYIKVNATGNLTFTNGAVSGYDSPQSATNISFDSNTSYWNVAAGGRVGMVIGEDGVQGGAPTTPTNPG
ncbi:hypothetical protein O9H85_36515 [Paenibacillus filicis]|uniref:Uncharacterized protein n=1 Tax=Paenibacillus gyeongsangnamensis TaxID=3388067 RepID=A0ABT4QLG5_9BACL|nr:hypothetical protein [Paenibacillus filicis]MCZ8517718.1 hypothetical protein [Paenibacillus filicis]